VTFCNFNLCGPSDP